jgi:hypothetical protein
MSGRRSGRAIHTGAIFDDRRLGPAQVEMYGILSTYADAETGWCHPRQGVLARRLGLSQGAVSQRITALADHGWLEVHDRYDPVTGARKSSEYRLVLDYVLPAEYDRMAGARGDEDHISSPNGVRSPAHDPFSPANDPISPANNLTGRPIRTTHPDALETPPETPGTPEGASPAPAPARETDRSMLSPDGPPRPVPKPRSLPVEPSPDPPPPPPPPRRPSAARGQRPRTEPPETLEPTPVQREWALGHGFTEATLAGEVERCLDHHRIEAKTSANWHASLRTWLTNEAAWAAADGRQPGVHLGKARPKVPATGRDYRETRRGRLPQQPAYTASAGAPNDPQVLESIRQRAKGW